MAIKSAFEHTAVSGGLSERNLKAYRTMSAVSNAASNVGESVKKQVQQQARQNAQENTVDRDTAKAARSTAMYAAPILTATVGSAMAVENYKRAMQRNFDAVTNLDDNASKLSQKLAEAGMVRNPDMTNEGLNSVFSNGGGPTVISAGGDTISPIGRMTQFNNGYTVTEIDMQGFAMRKNIDVGISFDANGKLVLSGPKITLDDSSKDYVKISAVSPKGEVSEITQLTAAKRNEIANNLKGFEKNVWGKFEPSSLGKNRDAFHYKVDGTVLRVTNMNGEAKAAAEMYTNLLRYNRRRSRIDGTDFLDKELKKQVEELRNAAKNLDKAKKQLKGVPKKFGKQSLRILTKELEQSDAAKGYRLGNAMVGGIRTVVKAGVPAGVGLSRFAVDNLYKGTAKVGNAILKKLGKDFRIPVLRDGLTTVLRRRITLMRARGRATAKAIGAALLNATPLGNTVFGQRLTNRIAISIAKDFGLDKALAKTALKAANKAVGKGVVGKAVEKVATKAANTAVGKVVGKIGKFAGKAISGVTNVILAPFRFLGRALNALKRAFNFILKKFILPVIGIWAALILIEMGFSLLIALFGAEDDRQSYVNMYTASSIEEWNTNSATIMDTLHSCHEDQLAELSEIQQKYEVADIQYPAGEQENYKELFCGILVTCQYDIGFFTTEELKDIATTLYERTHIVTESPYNIDGYDGTVGTNKACHIYLNVQRGTSLAYAILDQSGADDIDLSNVVSGECESGDWMQVVSNVKKLMALNAKTGAAGSHYYKDGNTGAMCWINLNGTNYRVRQDCSGFVSVCLQAYGSFAVGDSWGSSGFVGASSIPGFVKLRFSSLANCKIGDILCVYEGSYSGAQHHVEIFAGIFNGTAYVYNAGSDSSVINQGQTVAGGHRFTTIWRPVNPGTVIETGNNVENPENNNDDAGSSLINDVTLAGYEPGDEIWPYGYYFDKEDITLPFSNTAAVTFDEETGNESGYEDALKASVQTEMDSTSHFTSGYYVQDTNAHMVERNSGTMTTVNSIDFIRYIYAKHNVMIPFKAEDFYGNMDQGSIDDLKVGDIVVYIPHTTASDSIATVKPINKLYDADKVKVGDTVYDVSTSIYGVAIPMIYIGNNQAVAYSRDALGDATAYANPQQHPAAIKAYNVSDLDRERILEVIRPTGFTIANTYGHTSYFEGWTDMNIARLYIFINDTCWDTGTKVISDAEDFDVETAEDGSYSIDYSFYNKKSDMFSGNDVYWTSEHTDVFMADMLNELIRLYDEKGILPSIGYTKAYVLSKNRTTEESLSGFNVFEILSDNYGKSSTTDKYRYNDDGEATTTAKEYEKYSSLKNAIIDLYIDLDGKDTIFFINDKSTNPAGSFTLDLMNWQSFGNITADEAAKMKERYNQVAEQLQNADKNAIRIKELEDELLTLRGDLNSISATSDSGFHVDHGSLDYNSSCDKVDKAISDYNELVKIVNDYAIANPGRSIYTTNIKTNLDNAKLSIQNAEAKLDSAHSYHGSHSTDPGYIVAEGDEAIYDYNPMSPTFGMQIGTKHWVDYEDWPGKHSFTNLNAISETQ